MLIVGHVSNLKWLKQPKIDIKEVATFHSGEHNELEDITKNSKPKTVWSIENHPLELQRIKTEPKTWRESIWDLIENKTFWYHVLKEYADYIVFGCIRHYG